MDKRKISVSDDEDAPRKKPNKVSETKDSDILGQKIAALKLDRIPWTEITPESKKKKVGSDNQLEVDKVGSICERTLQVTPNVNREEHEMAIGQADASRNIRNPELKYSDNQLELVKGGSGWKRTFQIIPKGNRHEYEKAGKYRKIPEIKYSDKQLEVDKGGNLWERTRQVIPNVNREEYEMAIGHADANRNIRNLELKCSDNQLELVKGGSGWKRTFKITPKGNRHEYEKAGKYRKIPEVKYSDKQLEVDKGGNLWERTLQVNPKANHGEYDKALAHEVPDQDIKNPVLKNFQKKMKSPSGALKNIKSKILNVLKFNSTEISEKEEIAISEMNKSDEMSEESKSQTELEGFENVKSRVAHFGKTRDFWLSKLKSMSENSTKSNDATLSSTAKSHSSASVTQYDADSTTQTSENRSSKEVWDHFKKSLKSDIKSLDRMGTDDFNKENMELSSEYRIHSLEYPKPLAANRDLEKYAKAEKSMYRNLNDITTEVMEYSPIKSAAYQVDSSTMISSKNHPRQRIVYNEHDEDGRNWDLAHIKDREALLKFAILEGRFEEDFEKKMKCIGEAEYLQFEIDSIFDRIDENDRWASYPRQPIHSSRKDKKYKDDRENLRNLFQQLYKPSTFEYRCGDLFKRIDIKRFVSAFEKFFETEDNMKLKSDELEETLMKAVDELYSYLSDCRLVRKGKIPLAGNRSLTYYQNFIDVLDTAVDHNLECMRKIISLAYDIVPNPLYTYLSESYKTIRRRTMDFLNEERPDVFSKRTVDNEAFFDDFWERNFKN